MATEKTAETCNRKGERFSEFKASLLKPKLTHDSDALLKTKESAKKKQNRRKERKTGAYG